MVAHYSWMTCETQKVEYRPQERDSISEFLLGVYSFFG